MYRCKYLKPFDTISGVLLNSNSVVEESAKALTSETATKGLVEIFTGNGKGKTSAALGIALRAAGHGRRVYIVFFMKGEFPYGEQKTLSDLPNVDFDRYGFESFVDPANVRPEEKEEAQKALAAAEQAMFSKRYNVVILDEVNVAASWKLIDVKEIITLIKDRPEDIDLILTGRYADPRVIELADLVTEMVKIKHPYDKGIPSRRGIDY
jgi:cob(I)alamin adenosyltransferase